MTAAAANNHPAAAPAQRPRVGRPRDPGIDERIRRAARNIYATAGWAGLHFDGVAKAAQVSKDAVYRRYPNPQALLLESLADQPVPQLRIDGSIESSLTDYAIEILDFINTGEGYAHLRVHLDGNRYPELLREYQNRIIAPVIARGVAALESARDAGHLRPDTDCRALITALAGAMFIFTLSRSPVRGRARRAAIGEIRTIVGQLLRGT